MNLQNITLVLVDGVNPKASLNTLVHCSKQAQFHEILFFSFEEIETPTNITFNKIKKFNYHDYNNFIISELNNYIKSDFCLIVQTDGFILNPHKWQEKFLDFDYIGAPWDKDMQKHPAYESRVGNGGFSLRSKKFLETTSKFITNYETIGGLLDKNEDFFLCKTNYDKLTAQGVKFADIKTASEFSLEGEIDEYPRTLNDVFGFHGKNKEMLKVIDNIQQQEAITQKNLQEVYNNFKMNDHGGDKGTLHSYIPIYESLFKDKREDKISLLEIGVLEGHSLQMWSEYFYNADIIGLDIDLKKYKFSSKHNIELHECDATNYDQIINIVKDKSFDFIIDDGSHLLDHQIKTFNILFPYLKQGGLYIIEDILNIDKDRQEFEKLGQVVDIIDLRPLKNRYDDVMVIIKK
jgi:hypothetical protein